MDPEDKILRRSETMREVHTVLVSRPMTDKQKARLEEGLPAGIEVFYRDFEGASAEDVARADVIFGNVEPEDLAGAPHLAWVQLNSAGADNYVPFLPEGMLLTNASGAFGEPISEYMVGALLARMHLFQEYYDNQKEGIWHFRGKSREVPGSTCLVIGMGDIGGCFARKMKALGATVIGVRRTDTRKPDYCDELVLTADLDKVLPRADVVALSLPNTAQTAGILSAERIAAMKPGAYVINVGRGTAIDQQALCAALNEACLDVTVPEPLPADDPLWKAKNIMITPHVSGGRMLGMAGDRAIEIFLDNFRRFQAGQPLRNLVDRATGYRAL